MKEMNVRILGSSYLVRVGLSDELNMPDTLQGQCRYYVREIDIEHSKRGSLEEEPLSDEEMNNRTKGTVAHEVLHAYLKESGMNIPEEIEESLAVWFEVMWRKMNNTICQILDEIKILDK